MRGWLRETAGGLTAVSGGLCARRGTAWPRAGAPGLRLRVGVILLAVLVLLCLAGPGPARAVERPVATSAAPPARAAQADVQVPVPAWTAPVMDLSGTLDAAQIRTLANQVRLLQHDRGAQLFVLLVPTTGPDTTEQYARRVFDQWGVGRKGVDDGVLLLVAKQDRRVRIEVGYGLEGAVTDIAAGRIIREQITPRFAQGDFFGGVQAGVSALALLVRGEDLPPPPKAADDEDVEPYVMLLPLGLMALVAPWWIGIGLMGGFAFLVTNSLLWALLGALGGVLLVVGGRVTGITQRLRRSGLSSRRGRSGGGSGPWGGGFGGGSGGGGAGGGSGGGSGGSGGGGGASGGW